MLELRVGLDFGTTNSSAAIFDGERVQVIPLDPGAPDPDVMRTLLYLSREGERFYGQAALDRYMQQNIGRPVKLERRFTGTIEMTFAGVGTIQKDTYALVDVNEPGRFFQSIKSFLPDSSFQSTEIYGRRYSLEDLIALAAREMIQRIESCTGRPVQRLTVGRPVHFSEEPEKDALARTRQEAAFAQLGIPSLAFLEEPVAAAYDYARTTERPRTALIFDFGGGTLDVTVIRTGATAPQVLASGGVPVGGDLLDRRIVETHLLKHLGEDASVGSRRLPLPRTIFARLLHWQSMALLNRPETLDVIHNAIREGDRPRQLRALLTLISRNYGIDLYRTVEQTKRRLSDSNFTVLEFLREAISIREPLARMDFESAIRPQYLEVERCVLDTLSQAKTAPAAVDAIVTTGGSSRIPLFREMLHRHFPSAELGERATFTSVAAGLAVAGAQIATLSG